MHEGEWSARLGIAGQPAEAEELMVMRDIALARLTGCRIHFQHMSTRRSVEMIRQARLQERHEQAIEFNIAGLETQIEALRPEVQRLGSEIAQRDREFVQAARALGLSSRWILFRHILPNILPEILVMASLWMATAVRTEASLAFIGLGIAPPAPTWGGMVREGFDNILNSFHLALWPSVAILILYFAYTGQAWNVMMGFAGQLSLGHSLYVGVAAYAALLERGTKPSAIVIAGDSAGGGLAGATVLAIRERGLPKPAGAALICPWVDLAAREGSMIRNDAIDWLDAATIDGLARSYAGGAPLTDPLVSPLYGIDKGDAAALPPLLVQVGSYEILVDQAVEFAERGQAAGVDVALRVWEDMVHDWHFLANVDPVGLAAIEEIAAFVARVTSRSA